MKITSDKEIIFRHEKDGKVFYSMGLSHKTQDGNYKNDYMPVRFRKGVSLEDKAKIKIEEAWIDFYEGMKFIFINKFEEIQPKEEKKQDGWKSAKDIEIDDDALPFY